jgi:hypothetical protein
MPLQLLHIRGIFPGVLGLLAIWSCRPTQATPTLGDSTGSASCRLLIDRVGLGGQILSAPQGQLTPHLAKPAKPIKQMNGHSSRRIGQAKPMLLATLIQTGSLFPSGRKDLSLLGNAVVPFAKAIRWDRQQTVNDMAVARVACHFTLTK